MRTGDYDGIFEERKIEIIYRFENIRIQYVRVVRVLLSHIYSVGAEILQQIMKNFHCFGARLCSLQLKHNLCEF